MDGEGEDTLANRILQGADGIKHLGNQAFQHPFALRTTGEILLVGRPHP
jgi:hypothetical protein